MVSIWSHVENILTLWRPIGVEQGIAALEADEGPLDAGSERAAHACVNEEAVCEYLASVFDPGSSNHLEWLNKLAPRVSPSPNYPPVSHPLHPYYVVVFWHSLLVNVHQ